jgi:integrase
VLSRIFATAERASVVQRNPVRQLDQGERPAMNDREQRILSPTELQLLLSKAREFRALIAVGAFAGLRLGEALGLRWQEVDTKAGFLHVRSQLGHNRELGELKTGRSRRDVVLIPQLASVLRTHRMKSRFKRPADFVFPAPAGRGRDRRSSSRGIERAVERAGVGPLSFHGLCGQR